jgi:tripartite-type tricarboxylate transporter receptor subunit TctC
VTASLRTFVCLTALALAAPAFAQQYPNRPVRLVAPFAPGGPVDVVARLIAPKLSDGFGQQFYVENHPGASGNIGTALVAKAPADGHTVLVISSSLVVNPSLFDKLGFDTEKDLAPSRSSACRRRSCWCTRRCRRPISRS